MGNCGVGIAPCRPEAREVAMRDLVNVEAVLTRASTRLRCR
jgi:N-acyl-D-aspartate/D-glutamate deacylase